MNIQFRQYSNQQDYQRVADFLIEHYQPGNQDGNWIEPAWEYMHAHPLLDKASLGKIGVWEDAGRVVAVAHYEWRLGEAFFQFHPAYRHLRQEMLDYAEKYLFGYTRKDGRKHLRAYVNDNDPEFIELVRSRGYEKDAEEARPTAMFEIPDPFPQASLPEGFRITTLAEECDWAKVQRVLWRGFDHPGEPPPGEEELESERRLFDTPNGRREPEDRRRSPGW